MADSDSEYDFFVKIVVIGDSGVGKSTLLSQLCDHQFVNCMATIGVDFKLKIFEIEGKKLKA